MRTAYSFSANGIENFLADYILAAEVLCGNSHLANSVCNALVWYVSTGRASTDFVKAMLLCSPKALAKESLRGGSDEEIIARLKRRIKSH